jgi:hypothetical protein
VALLLSVVVAPCSWRCFRRCLHCRLSWGAPPLLLLRGVGPCCCWPLLLWQALLWACWCRGLVVLLACQARWLPRLLRALLLQQGGALAVVLPWP